MLFIIRTLSVKNFVRFSLWLARLTLGKHWLSQEKATREYLENCMPGMNSSEYLKIWEAIYGFDLLPLENITCPIFVLNGEYESKSTYRHTKEILRRIPQSTAKVVPKASHAMNIDNQKVYNNYLEEFLITSA
jgi:pimeloyl-ACP methyl ester carboxylesterase